MSKLFGRGLLYIFVGIYYLNVVSGGVEGAFRWTGFVRVPAAAGALLGTRSGGGRRYPPPPPLLLTCVITAALAVAFDKLKEDPSSLDGALPFLVGCVDA